jgi:hypothetical protein
MLWSNILPHVRVSHGRTLRPCVYSMNDKIGENYHTLKPCAYSMNGKVGGNYYAQRKKMRARRELNPRPWL